MHLELLPQDGDLFRLLVPHPDSTQPSRYDMPALPGHQFLLRNHELLLHEQEARRRAQTAEVAFSKNLTRIWVHFDPLRPQSHTALSLTELISPHCTYMSTPTDDPLKLSHGEHMSNVSSGSYVIDLVFKPGPWLTYFTEYDGTTPVITYYHHDKSRHPWLCPYCHQHETRCAPRRSTPDPTSLKWSCPVYRMIFPDRVPPDHKSLSIHQLMDRYKSQSNKRSTNYGQQKKSQSSQNQQQLKKSRHSRSRPDKSAGNKNRSSD